MKPPLIRTTRHYSSSSSTSSRVYPAAVTLDASSKKRRFADISDSVMLEDRSNNKTTLNDCSLRRVDSMEKKKMITKSSEDVRIRAPVQYTQSHTKNASQITTMKPPLNRTRHSSSSSTSRDYSVHSSAVKDITKWEDVRIRAPVQPTKKNDDDSRSVLIQPEKRVKLVQVEVEHLGGLKFRFRFSSGNIRHRKSSGDDAAAAAQVTKNLAVRKTTQHNCPASAARVKKRGLQETAEPDHCATVEVKKPETPEREQNQKIESMTKTVDIPNNYYDIMGKLDGMFGDREWVMEAFYGVRNQKPLEKLGLYLKD